MRRKAVKAEFPPVFNQFDRRVRIRHAFRLLRCKKFLTPYQTRNHIERIRQIRPCRRKRLIRFPYRFVLKHRLIGSARRRIMRQQHHACRILVQAVQRRNVFNIQMLQFRAQAQTCQQRFPQKTPAGDDGQKMRLVHDNQMLINMQNLFFKRNTRFILTAGFTIIKHRLTRLEQSMFVQRRTIRTDHKTAVQPPAPIVRAHKRKADAQKMQQRQPVKLLFMRQHQITGFDTVQQRKRIIAFFHAADCNRFSQTFQTAYQNIIDKNKPIVFF